MREGKESDLARKCWEKMGERMRKGMELSGWERKKEEFFVKRRMIVIEVERKRKYVREDGEKRKRKTERRKVGEDKGIEIQ